MHYAPPSPGEHAHTQKGFSTLMGVLVVGAMVSALSVSMIAFGLQAERGSAFRENAARAHALAEACADEALRLIQENVSYTGTGTVSLGGEQCAYTVANGGGAVRTIDASATVQNHTARVAVETNTVAPVIVLQFWEEVLSF